MDCLTKVRRSLQYRMDSRAPTGIIMTRKFHYKLLKELEELNVQTNLSELFGLRIIVADDSYPADTILSKKEFIITPARYS